MIGDIRIHQVQKFKYLGSVTKVDGNSNTNIHKCIGIELKSKTCLPETKKNIKKQQNFIEIKIRVLICYAISLLPSSIECWTISSQLKRRLEATEMSFYRRILRMPWMEHVNNEEVLGKMWRKWILLLKIRKKQLKFTRYIIRKWSMENLTLSGHSEGRRSKREIVTY